MAVPTAPSISSGTSFAAVVLAASAAAKESNANQAATLAGSGTAETSKLAAAAIAAGRRPLPNARSRWKKLTGTAMFINRLGKTKKEMENELVNFASRMVGGTFQTD